MIRGEVEFALEVVGAVRAAILDQRFSPRLVESVRAMRDKMDLAFTIAVGSSFQVALFVAPLLVGASYFLGPQPIDLHFSALEVMAVVVSIGILSMVTQDGESNWIEGALLLAVYLILALAFYHAPADLMASVVG